MKRIATSIACALLLPAVVTAQQQTTATQPSRRVEIDLRSTAAAGTVPFDVPFELTGNVPDRVDRIELRYRDCRDGKCPKTIARDVECQPVVTDGWSAPVIWQHDALTGVAAPGQAIRFTLPVDALEAQRRYAFLFDVQGSPTDDQIAAFRPRVRDVISRRLGAVTSSDQPETFFTDLRSQIIRELRDLTRNCIATDDFLQEATDIDAGFTERFADIQDAQINKANAVDTFNTNAEQLRASLAEISQAQLLAILPANEQAAHADVMKFLALDPAQFNVVARGAAPLAPDRTLASMTEDIPAEAATARANALIDTEALLRSLSLWFKQLDQRGALNDSGLTAEQRTALQRTIDAAASRAFVMRTTATSIARNTTEREQFVNSFADAVREQLRTLRLLGSDTIGSYDTFSAWYVSADAGFAYGPDVQVAVPYLGANIYFRPINKDAPLRLKGGIERRVSATIALTASSIADKQRKDLFNTQSLLLGGGFRLTDTLRLGGGVLVYKELNSDPTAVSSSDLGISPYVSVSFDWNVAKQFAGVGKLFQ
jgi:hypothetical protein